MNLAEIQARVIADAQQFNRDVAKRVTDADTPLGDVDLHLGFWAVDIERNALANQWTAIFNGDNDLQDKIMAVYHAAQDLRLFVAPIPREDICP